MPAATFNATFAGTTIAIDSSGNTTMTGAAGATLTFTYNGSSIIIDGVGNIKFALASSGDFDILRGGSASDALVLVSKMVAAFNAHVHHENGTGNNTNTPLVQLSDNDLSSDLVNIQS